ncbi:hypothetical protein ABEB36_010677 [Hypothenemus hampei]|uniref:Uncharacterized protein n=1 Tax=Hypothenemus hampei TaxID=57062 RepID=A0ABD1ECZ6_HYPHA
MKSQISPQFNDYNPDENKQIMVEENEISDTATGWIARKFKDTYPDLGEYTYKMRNDHNYNTPSWVQHLSFGGLNEPSKKWLQQIKEIDRRKGDDYFFKKLRQGAQETSLPDSERQSILRTIGVGFLIPSTVKIFRFHGGWHILWWEMTKAML